MKRLSLGLALAFSASMACAAPAPPSTLVGGWDASNSFAHALSVDSLGRLNIIGSGSTSVVFGPDAQGVAPTQSPNVMACVFNNPTVSATQVVRIQCDANGHPIVVVSGSIAATQSGTWNINAITTLPTISLGASGNVIGGVTQSGTWNINAITTLPAVAGAVAAADGSALTLTLKDFALNGVFNGTTEDMARSVQGASAGTGIGVTAVAHVPTSSANGGIVEVTSAAVESGHVGKALAGNLYRVAVTTGATAGWLMVFNSATVPANGAVTPVLCRLAPANASVEVDHSTMPDFYGTGISAAFSSTGCFTLTLSATAAFELAVK